MKKSFKNKPLKSFGLLFIIVVIAAITFTMCDSSSSMKEPVKIAKWKGNKKAALTIYFDDSTMGQAQLGVPAMIQRGLTGTWFVNPGREYYNANKEVWDSIAQLGGQELANHTMHHRGAKDYDETVYEVGEASKIIWQIRGQEENGSLIAFQRGGSTTWNSDEDLKKVIKDFHNIERSASAGEKTVNKTVPQQSTAGEMYDLIFPELIDSCAWGRMTFHGISPDSGKKDYGNGAVWFDEFQDFLDTLLTTSADVWVGGYTQVYKYIIERDSAEVSIVNSGNDSIVVSLESGLDPKYFDESLTLLVNVPSGWKECIVKLDEDKSSCGVIDGVAMFDAKPGQSIILLKKE